MHSFSKTLFNSLTFVWLLGFFGNAYMAGHEALYPAPYNAPLCLNVWVFDGGIQSQVP